MSVYPKVSVAIVTYNQKTFLEECIASVLMQQYPNLEIVVADDGSKDGTQEMLRKYESDHPGLFQLRLSETNKGITNNHNQAYQACTGDYVAWIGGDDLMVEGKLHAQVAFMEANANCVVSYHQLNILDSATGRITGLFNTENNTHEGDVSKLIKYGSFNGACSCMVRASAQPQNGFNTLLPIASDWLYYIECLVNGGEIRYIDQTLGTYRRHAANATDESNPRFIQNVVDHLATCSIVTTRYPAYSKDAFSQYTKILRRNRKILQLDYRVLPHFLDFKSLLAYFIYKLSFHKIRL